MTQPEIFAAKGLVDGAGRGHGESAGEMGASRSSRGGVFLSGRSDPPAFDRGGGPFVAQIMLVPVDIDTPISGTLPRAGQAGDLLVVRSRSERTAMAKLWLCRNSGSSDPAQPGATWARVAFDTTVVVS